MKQMNEISAIRCCPCTRMHTNPASSASTDSCSNRSPEAFLWWTWSSPHPWPHLHSGHVTLCYPHVKVGEGGTFQRVCVCVCVCVCVFLLLLLLLHEKRNCVMEKNLFFEIRGKKTCTCECVWVYMCVCVSVCLCVCVFYSEGQGCFSPHKDILQGNHSFHGRVRADWWKHYF